METHRLGALGLVCLFAFAISFVPRITYSSPILAPASSVAYLPIVVGPANPAATTTPGASSAIIADHTTTGLQIPSDWITQAKAALRLSYGHTSHGSQLISGATFLKTSLYNFNTNGSTQVGVLSIADYTPTGDLGNPDRTTWATLTRNYLNTTGATRNVVMWAWCGQVSSASSADMSTYLNLMGQLETDFPNVKFVYFTGHLDGTGTSGNLYARNNQIRNFVQANNKLLFDFADIESYDPSGVYYPNADDSCPWCQSYCDAHPGFCPSPAISCAHSHSLNCMLKGQAFWWLMARLAGWNGS